MKNSILNQIKRQSIVEPTDVSNSCLLRSCFDSTSTEWKESTLDKKVEALKKLINEDDETILKLSVGMMDYCNSEEGKDIKPMELVVSMSRIIDHLLKRGIENPWIDYDFGTTKIHHLDKLQIDEFNIAAKPEFEFDTTLLPDPYIGKVNSKILLLALNPGIHEDDYEIHKGPIYRKLHRENINQIDTEYPFYYLNPELNSPGTKWWHSKLKHLIENFGVRKTAQAVCCLQYVPYHSKKFKKLSKNLPTQEFVKKIIETHIKNNKPIVMMRSKSLWIKLVPELEFYKNIFSLRNPRTPALSPKNVGEENFKLLINAMN